MLAAESNSFFDFKLANYLTLAGIALSYLSYHLSSKKEKTKQIERHTENRIQLETLVRFQTNQEGINRKRDEQVHELSLQTSTIAEMAKGLTLTIAEMAKGFNRRLEMLEDR